MLTRRDGRSFDFPILMYHHLEPGEPTGEFSLSIRQFARHVDCLRDRGFTAVTFGALFDALDGRRRLPAKPVMITFDDGYESFRELAVPVLVERRMTATVFVVAGEIGGFNRWDAPAGHPRRGLMNDSGIRDVLDAGMELGAHGWSHRDLTACSDAEAREEVVRSGAVLRERFGVAVEAFAYPYGRHAAGHAALLRTAGYRAAVSIFSTASTVTENLFAMRRLHIHSGDDGLRFRAKLSPAYLRYTAWRDGRAANGVPLDENEAAAHG